MMFNMVSAHNERFPFPRMRLSLAAETKWQELGITYQLAQRPYAPYCQPPHTAHPSQYKKPGSFSRVQQIGTLQRFESWGKEGGGVVHTPSAFRQSCRAHADHLCEMWADR